MELRQKLARALCEAHPTDGAATLERLRPEEAAAFLSGVRAALAAPVLQRFTAQRAAQVLARLDASNGAAILAEIDANVATTILRRMDEAQRQALLSALPPQRSRSLRSQLDYPEGTAGALADPYVLALPADLTAREALRVIRQPESSAYHNVYVLDRDDVLVGVVNLRDLLLARPGQRLSALIKTPVISLPHNADRHAVAAHPAWRDYRSMPVVDGAGRFVGAIRYHALRRLEEELHRVQSPGEMSAAEALGDLYRTALGGLMEAVSLGVAAPAAAEESSHGA